MAAKWWQSVNGACRFGLNTVSDRYYRAWEESELLFIQMELCSEGSLKDYELKHTITEDDLWRFLACLMLGLRHVHESNFLHLDIKPGNILVANDLSVKIGDFGIAQRSVVGVVWTSTCCTAAPTFLSFVCRERIAHKSRK